MFIRFLFIIYTFLRRNYLRKFVFINLLYIILKDMFLHLFATYILNFKTKMNNYLNIKMLNYNKGLKMKKKNLKDIIITTVIDICNKEGLYKLSMSKLAKQAGISSASVYTYFESKDDMLSKVYMDLQYELSQALYNNVEKEPTTKRKIYKIFENIALYAKTETEKINFIDKSANTAISDKSSKKMLAAYFLPVVEVFEKGIKEQILKKADAPILFIFSSLSVLRINMEKFATRRLEENYGGNFVFDLAWDAIRNPEWPDNEIIPEIRLPKTRGRKPGQKNKPKDK